MKTKKAMVSGLRGRFGGMTRQELDRESDGYDAEAVADVSGIERSTTACALEHVGVLRRLLAGEAAGAYSTPM